MKEVKRSAAAPKFMGEKTAEEAGGGLYLPDSFYFFVIQWNSEEEGSRVLRESGETCRGWKSELLRNPWKDLQGVEVGGCQYTEVLACVGVLFSPPVLRAWVQQLIIHMSWFI